MDQCHLTNHSFENYLTSFKTLCFGGNCSAARENAAGVNADSPVEKTETDHIEFRATTRLLH